MILRSLVGGLRRNVLTAVHRRPALLGTVENVVSFTFDDFPRSAYSVAGPILKRYGVHATYYAAMGLVESENHLGEHFRLEDLEALTSEGHELGNHTFSHVSARRVGIEKFLSDVKKGSVALKSLNGVDALCNFAYPFGDATFRTKKALGSVVKSARGIIPGLNGPEFDLNLLRANPLYGGMDRYEQMKGLVRENQRCHSWLIFYTHDVRMRPSPYGCTPELFGAVLSYVLEHGARVMTVSRMLREIEAAAQGAYSHSLAIQ